MMRMRRLQIFAAAEMAAAPAMELAVELMDRFTKWINSLQVYTDCRPLKSIIQTGDFLERKFLDFNYTEFIEELYGVRKVMSVTYMDVGE